MFFVSNTVRFDAKNEMLISTYWSKSLKCNELQKLFLEFEHKQAISYVHVF